MGLCVPLESSFSQCGGMSLVPKASLFSLIGTKGLYDLRWDSFLLVPHERSLWLEDLALFTNFLCPWCFDSTFWPSTLNRNRIMCCDWEQHPLSLDHKRLWNSYYLSWEFLSKHRRGGTKLKSTTFSVKPWDDRLFGRFVFDWIGHFWQVKPRLAANWWYHSFDWKTIPSLFGCDFHADWKNALVWMEKIENDSSRVP